MRDWIKQELQSSGRTETIVKIPHENDGYEEIRLFNQNGEIVESKKWRIFSESDELPESLRQNEMTKQFEYGLSIGQN